MSADKRDFSNFHKFPGCINTTGICKGWYSFPPVYSIDSMGRRRVWSIWVRLIITKNGNDPTQRSINWDTGFDTVFPLTNEFLNKDFNNIPKNVIAQHWTVQGIDDSDKDSVYKKTVSIPTYTTTGKNLGKTNATTVFTQALIVTRSKYLKKKETSSEQDNGLLVFPMAVHKYDVKPYDESKHLQLPVVVQRKLDGERAVSYYDKKTNNPFLYTRKLKYLSGNEYILKALKLFFESFVKKYPNVYLDGELYKSGLSLQVINGLARREKDSKTTEKEKKNFPKKKDY
jgi:hypothetical protein